MDSDLLRALCALAAFVLPLLFASAIVWWQGRPQGRLRRREAGRF
jgi:hypothetical protein